MRDLPHSTPRTRTTRGYAGSHQRAWLWGRHAVLETLAAARWPVLELFISDALANPDLLSLQQAAARLSLPLQTVSGLRLEQLCRQPDHQGVAARMGPFPIESISELTIALRTSNATFTGPSVSIATAPLYVMLDRIQDPWNFGAILRSCDAVRASGVIIGTSSQSSVTPHVARASSGAVNHLQIFQTDDLVQTLVMFRLAGFRIAAASEKSPNLLWDTPLSGPLLLIIGSEALGVAPELLASTDVQAAIPMLGSITSLNAAVAAGILLYECRRQSGLSSWERPHAH
ncbi:MAG: TrmH family RNA methyltransferase [Planctomycetota bacterium]